MPALDLRRMIGQLVTSEGVIGSADFTVTQRGAGANMSVDVAAGSAYVKDDHGAGGGVYAATWTATENVTIAAADPTNPRIDRIVLQIKDNALGDGANSITLQRIAGTPTAGATLVNLNGAGAVPGSSLLLANVLVPAAASSIVNANIDSSSTVRVQASLGGVSSQRKTSSKTVNNSVADTDLLNGEFTLKANTLGTTGRARLWLSGDWLNNTGSAHNPPAFKLKLGGTTLLDTGNSASLSASANRGAWELYCNLMNLGATGSQEVGINGMLYAGVDKNFSTGNGCYSATKVLNLVGRNNGSVDTTADQALVFSVVNNVANASYETRLLCAVLIIE